MTNKFGKSFVKKTLIHIVAFCKTHVTSVALRNSTCGPVFTELEANELKEFEGWVQNKSANVDFF